MKQNEMNEPSIKSFNVRESDPSTLLERRCPKIFHSIPSDVRESKWRGFVQEQLEDHLIAHVRENIITTAIETVTEKQLYEKKLFQFTSECAREAWLRVLNWVSPKLDPYWRCDKSGRATHLIIDAELQPPPIDLWMFGNVEQTYLEKTPPPETFVSRSKSAIADRSATADRREKVMEQKRAKSKDSEREKLEQKDRMKRTPSTILCELSKSIEMSNQRKKVSRYVGANVCTLSVPEKHISGDIPTKAKDQPTHVKEEKIDYVSKVKKQTAPSPVVKKQDLINIHRRQSTKDIKKNEINISAQRESILQYQPSTDRVDILYTVLPEQNDQRRTSNTLNLKRKK